MSAKTMCFVWGLTVNPEMKFVLLALADGCADYFNRQDAISMACRLTGYSQQIVERVFDQALDDGIIIGGKGLYEFDGALVSKALKP